MRENKYEAEVLVKGYFLPFDTYGTMYPKFIGHCLMNSGVKLGRQDLPNSTKGIWQSVTAKLLAPENRVISIGQSVIDQLQIRLGL